MREWCGTAVEVSGQAQYQDRIERTRPTLISWRRLAVFTLTLVLVAGVHVAWVPATHAAPAAFVEQRITLNGLDADLTLERVGADYTVSINYLDEAPARFSVTVQQTLYDSSDGDLMSCVDTSWSDNVCLENGRAVFAPTIAGQHATLDLGELPLRSFQRVFINLETSAATSVAVHAVITDNWGTRHELRSPSRSIPAGGSTINQNLSYMIPSGSSRPEGLNQINSLSIAFDGLDPIMIHSVVLTATTATVRPGNDGEFQFAVPIVPCVEFEIAVGDATQTLLLEDLVGPISMEYVSHLNVPRTADFLVRVDANPEAGFHWPYYLFVPSDLQVRPYLLVEPNNTGRSSDDQHVHESSALMLASRRYPNTMARELRIPLLVPVFPRPTTQEGFYTQCLSPGTFQATSGPFARIDLQLAAMIGDARRQIEERGMETQEKVLMHGFSMSGTFSHRFVVLHPELVEAYAVGGVGAYLTLPTEIWKGIPLQYPFGVGDLQDLAGVRFDRGAFDKVRRYIYYGDLDPWHKDTSITRRVVGHDPAIMWVELRRIFNKLGVPNEFVAYPGVGHDISSQMLEHVIRFFSGIIDDQ